MSTGLFTIHCPHCSSPIPSTMPVGTDGSCSCPRCGARYAPVFGALVELPGSPTPLAADGAVSDASITPSAP